MNLLSLMVHALVSDLIRESIEALVLSYSYKVSTSRTSHSVLTADVLD
jgi:hypothetical protein